MWLDTVGESWSVSRVTPPTSNLTHSIQLQIYLLQSWKGQETAALMWYALTSAVRAQKPMHASLRPKGRYLTRYSSIVRQTNMTDYRIQFSDVSDFPLFHAYYWSTKPLIKNQNSTW